MFMKTQVKPTKYFSTKLSWLLYSQHTTHQNFRSDATKVEKCFNSSSDRCNTE